MREGIKELEELYEVMTKLEHLHIIHEDLLYVSDNLMNNWFKTIEIDRSILEQYVEDYDIQSWYYFSINENPKNIKAIVQRLRITTKCCIYTDTYCQETILKEIDNYAE
nr:hypothetical protein [uncultured Sulfurimonas sp.]